MLLLRRRRLPLALRKVAIPLAVGPGLAVLLAVLAIVALHSEVVQGAPRLLGAHLMHPLFVFGLMTVELLLTEIVIQAPNPSNVLGVFGLSIRTTERDLDEEFGRFGHVEKVTIVYDQRVCLALCPVITTPI